MYRYVRQQQYQISICCKLFKQRKNNTNKQQSNNAQSSNAESLVIRSRSREVISQASYNMTLIVANLMDLPYHVVYVVYWMGTYNKCNNKTTSSPNETVYEILKLFFVFNHSINFCVFLKFHHEFKSTLWKCCCCCVRI